MKPVRSALLLSAGFGLGYRYRGKLETDREANPEVQEASLRSKEANIRLKDATTDFVKAMKAVVVDAWVEAKDVWADAREAEGPVVVKFDKETSKNWSDDAEVNLIFLRTSQNYLNDLLKVRGHVFLNDVYDQLGLPRTSQGAIVGWLLTSESKIEFGEDLKPDDEGAITLSFDIDGVIYDKLDT